MRSTTQNARAPHETTNHADAQRDAGDPVQRHSVVTPLFAHVTPRPKAVVRFGGAALVKRSAAIVGALALIVAGGWLWHQNRIQQRATERLALGCLDVSDCRSVIQNIEALQDACMFDCSPLATLAQQARSQFRLVLEQQAEAEQATRDKAYQTAIQSRKALEDEHIKLSQVSRLAEREHEHRLELERLAAQTERLRAAQSSASSAQLAYFKQLSPEQRLNRLSACHKRGTPCEDLVQQLAQAAPTLAEQRALIVAHEEYVTKDPAESRENKPLAPLFQANSEPKLAERL